MAADGNFDVATERSGSALIVSPDGEIDLATVGIVRAAVDAERADVDGIVIDLRAVSFMDTSALRYILELHEHAQRDGFELELVRGPSAVQRVFAVSGLEARLPFVDDASAR